MFARVMGEGYAGGGYARGYTHITDARGSREGGGRRARGCRNTAKAGRSDEKAPGELAVHVALSGTETSGVGRAVKAVPGLSGAGWRGPGRRVSWCRGSGADEKLRVVSKEHRLRCRGGGGHLTWFSRGYRRRRGCRRLRKARGERCRWCGGCRVMPMVRGCP